jgi:hypothetical protein
MCSTPFADAPEQAMLAHRVLTRKRFSHCLFRGRVRFAELLNVTSLPPPFDPRVLDAVFGHMNR